MDIRNQIIEPDCFYHIYNRGINSGKVFSNHNNYLYFLLKFSTYLNNVCDVYSYCLMPNHFHFLLKIKSQESLQVFCENNFQSDKEDIGLHAVQNIFSKQMAKFISCYSQSYNKEINRHGALFESPFKRKKIDSQEYLQKLIMYIHQNPVGINQNYKTYKFSSYAAIISNGKTNIRRNEVLELFDGGENFIYCHQKPIQDLVF